ncbi:MAG: hypothetical protein ACW98X_20065 [Promethearchaeota archaeon]|jgi:hypothetical protein
MSVYLSTPGYSNLELEIEDPPASGNFIFNPLLNVFKFDAPQLDFNLEESIVPGDTVHISLDGTIRTHVTSQRETKTKRLLFPFLDTTERDLLMIFIEDAQGDYIKLTTDVSEQIFLPVTLETTLSDEGRAEGIGQDVDSLKHTVIITARMWDR